MGDSKHLLKQLQVIFSGISTPGQQQQAPVGTLELVHQKSAPLLLFTAFQ